MGSRGDYSWREVKKRKKGARKTVAPVPVEPPREVEVVPKGKKRTREGEE